MINSHLPSIYIEECPKEEVELFYQGLHNSFRPWQRDLILKCFSPLKDILENTPDVDKKKEIEIIGKFLANFRKDHQQPIQNFITLAHKELEKKSAAALSELAKLMDYQWPGDHPNYRVVPVMLPYSPFGENVFFYGMLGAAWGKQKMGILFNSIHEISHMIFYEVLKKTHPELVNLQDSDTSSIAIDDLKEILAPVLINQPQINKFLNLSNFKKGYMGNPYLEKMYVIKDGWEKKAQISKYFQQLFEQMKYQEQKSFPEIVEEIVKLILPLEAELRKRRDIWNKHQDNILQNEELLEKYSQPLKI